MFNLPEFVIEILTKLESNNYSAYAVGGCVRDILLNKEPFDYDIATSCPPETISKLFDKTYDTGIKHGTVTVVTDYGNVEITTFRADGTYQNHRSPDKVIFVDDLITDLSRRDFTINSMALSKNGHLIDHFGGQKDIKCRIIRTVGDPDERFNEDALRILRAFRFASNLDFSIDSETLDAALKNCNLLKYISPERIFKELSKGITGINPNILKKLIISGGLNFLGLGCVKNFENISKLPQKLNLRFVAFAESCGADPATLCTMLKTDNNLKNYCQNFSKVIGSPIPKDRISIKRLMSAFDIEVLRDYSLYSNIFYNTDDINHIINDILTLNEPFKISHLAVNGTDLKKMGLRDKQIGQTLEHLLNLVITDPKNNTKSLLITTLKKSN